MDTADGDEDTWRPPTEAEMKVIHARRERSDKISKLMGEYMLKGYRMLGSVCDECGTILLQDRQGRNYCVACSELDTEHAKDDPALSEEAAHSQVQEGFTAGASSSQVNMSHPPIQTDSPVEQPEASFVRISPRILHSTSEPSPSLLVQQKSGPTSTCSETDFRMEGVSSGITAPAEIVLDSLGGVTRKMAWATHELERTTSVEYSIQLCELIKSCGAALQSIQGINITNSAKR